jgi:hypothetical protein
MELLLIVTTAFSVGFIHAYSLTLLTIQRSESQVIPMLLFLKKNQGSFGNNP